ncbi:MAG: hypothetical protein DCC49_05460 [Acidobacteria bacterium]|nr:MAG: hypothetical protein DCC49_05460 [Acidobacteriota bacterium]
MQPTPLTPVVKKRSRKWLIAAGIPFALVVVALMAGTVLKIADPTYRSDSRTGGVAPEGPQRSQPAEKAPLAPEGEYVASDETVGRAGSPGTTSNTPDSVPDSSGPERVIKTGDLSIAVPDGEVQQAYTRAGAIARELGGYVSSSATSTGSKGGTASIVVRVPAERFEEMAEKASALGEVRSMSTSGQDVSAQFVDLEARLRNLEAQRDQILTLMSQAKTVQETITIQDRLFSVTEQIERIKGQLKTLESKTAYSTLNISISQASAPPAGDGWGTGKALSRAAHAFVDTLNGFIVLMGPLAFLGILALMVWIPVRAAVRRRRQITQTADLPETPAA